MKKIAVLSLALMAMVAGMVCSADNVCRSAEKQGGESARHLKVLMIGNSFSVCCLQEMPKVAKSMGLGLDLCSLYIGGCSLKRHCDNIAKASNPNFKPYSVRRSVNGERRPEMKGNIPEMLKADQWDVVTIQQCSHESWQPQSYHPYGDNLVKTIRELAPQAKIVVQETWSYTPWDRRLTGWKMDQDQMFQKLHGAYADFAAEYHFPVIPMGTAVQRWRRQLPVKYAPNSFGGDVCGSAKFEKNEQGEFKPKGDVFHLNSDGHYLQALVWTASLYGADVTTCPYAPKSLCGPKAELMKRIATEVAGLTPPQVIRIGIVTDTHVGTNGGNAQFKRLEASYRLFKSHGVTNIFNLGDIADFNVAEDYRKYRKIRETVYPDGVDEVFVYHNHDQFGRHPVTKERINLPRDKAFGEAQKLLGDKYGQYHHFKLAGFAFFSYPLGVDPERIDRDLAAAAKEHPDYPIFVLNHVPPTGTSAGSEAGGSPVLRKILNKYPQVVALTGHVHGSVTHEGKIWQKEFTAIGFGALKEMPCHSELYHVAIMELDSKKAVIRRYELSTGEELRPEDPWTLEFPYDPVHPKYSREVRAKTTPRPTFAENAHVVPHVHLGGLTITFPAAKNPEWTESYSVALEDHDHDHDHPRAVKTIGRGEYCLPASKRNKEYHAHFEDAYFNQGDKVKVAVTPEGFFGNHGDSITTEATIGGNTNGAWKTVYSADAAALKKLNKGRLTLAEDILVASSKKVKYRLVFDLSSNATEAFAGRITLRNADGTQAGLRMPLPSGSFSTRRFVVPLKGTKTPVKQTFHIEMSKVLTFHSFRIERSD